MVTGGNDRAYLDSTEIFSDNFWRYVAKLPTPMQNVKVATINNRVLAFGNSFYLLFCDEIKCITLGGYDHFASPRKDILEFNQETESWTVIGAMKEQKSGHAVSVVSYDDYEKWCN